MTRPLCGISAPWDLSLQTCTAQMAHVLRELALYPLAERVERAKLPVELRPVLRDVRAHAETARAALYGVMADRKGALADEVVELCGILLQRTARKAG